MKALLFISPRTDWPALVIVFIALILAFNNGVAVPDAWLVDRQFAFLRAYSPETRDSEVVIVAIDEVALNASERPLALWHRHYGELFERLLTAQPRAVGLDVVLPARSYARRYPGTDMAVLRGLQALRQAQVPVVLATSINDARQPRAVYGPFAALAHPRYGTGSDVLIPAADHIVRRHTEAFLDDGGRLPTFAGQIARALGKSYSPGMLDHRRTRQIPVIPAGALLFGHAVHPYWQDAIKGKVVIIGSVLGDQDRLPQSFPLDASWPADSQPGVVVQAHFVSAILDHALIDTVPMPVIAGMILLSLGLWLVCTTVLRCAVALGIFIVTALAVSTVLLAAGWYLPLAAAFTSALMLAITRLLLATWQARQAVLMARTRVQAHREFIDAVSHDLKAPAGAIVATIDLLETQAGSADTNRLVGLLRRSAQQIEQQAHELLDLSRWQAGYSTPAAESFDLYSLLVDLVVSMRPVAEREHLDLSLSISARVDPARQGARVAVCRLLQNLLTNAIKYSRTGTVRLRLLPGSEPGRVRFEVKDDGNGIPAEKIAQIFKPYERFDTDQPGAGLGMSIVRRIVAALGGEVGINSRQGKGSTVWVEVPLDFANKIRTLEPVVFPRIVMSESCSGLPAWWHDAVRDWPAVQSDSPAPSLMVGSTVDVPGTAVPGQREFILTSDGDACQSWKDVVWQFGLGAVVCARPEQEVFARLLRLVAEDWMSANDTWARSSGLPVADVTGTKRILLVDDQEVVRTLWSGVLAADGYAVETAENGASARARLRAHNYDLLILDQRLPDVTGTALAAEMRRMTGLCGDLPILLLTADPGAIQTTADITAVMSKSVRPPQLREWIRLHVGK